MSTGDRQLIDEQIAYYRARAPEYDQWFTRQGRYNHGEEERRAWSSQIEQVQRALAAEQPCGDMLELACGTGLWTWHLVKSANALTAIDASPEVIERNRRRVQSPRVEYVEADLFRWQPARQYDFVFFGFWLSHVPAERFEPFWQLVRAALKPEGRAFFVDSLFMPSAAAVDHAPIDRTGIAQRKLNDGRTYRVVKHFYDPARLEQDLCRLGWKGYVLATDDFFLYGCFGVESCDI